MDDETKAYLDTMMARINDQFERVLGNIGTLKADFQNSKSFLVDDALIMGRQMLSLEDRVSRMERKPSGD